MKRFCEKKNKRSRPGCLSGIDQSMSYALHRAVHAPRVSIQSEVAGAKSAYRIFSLWLDLPTATPEKKVQSGYRRVQTT